MGVFPHALAPLVLQLAPPVSYWPAPVSALTRARFPKIRDLLLWSFGPLHAACDAEADMKEALAIILLIATSFAQTKSSQS